MYSIELTKNSRGVGEVGGRRRTRREEQLKRKRTIEDSGVSHRLGSGIGVNYPGIGYKDVLFFYRKERIRGSPDGTHGPFGIFHHLFPVTKALQQSDIPENIPISQSSVQ